MKAKKIVQLGMKKRKFSVVDVISVFTESPNPQTYWRVLKKTFER